MVWMWPWSSGWKSRTRQPAVVAACMSEAEDIGREVHLFFFSVSSFLLGGCGCFRLVTRAGRRSDEA